MEWRTIVVTVLIMIALLVGSLALLAQASSSLRRLSEHRSGVWGAERSRSDEPVAHYAPDRAKFPRDDDSVAAVAGGQRDARIDVGDPTGLGTDIVNVPMPHEAQARGVLAAVCREYYDRPDGHPYANRPPTDWVAED
jgi:hypothetical protein